MYPKRRAKPLVMATVKPEPSMPVATQSPMCGQAMFDALLAMRCWHCAAKFAARFVQCKSPAAVSHLPSTLGPRTHLSCSPPSIQGNPVHGRTCGNSAVVGDSVLCAAVCRCMIPTTEDCNSAELDTILQFVWNVSNSFMATAPASIQPDCACAAAH